MVSLSDLVEGLPVDWKNGGVCCLNLGKAESSLGKGLLLFQCKRISVSHLGNGGGGRLPG